MFHLQKQPFTQITQVTKWWDTLCQLGSRLGCHPKGEKSLLLIQRNQQYAVDIFCGTSIKITTYGQRHLGSTEYKRMYMHEKTSQWIKELQMLCKVAWLEPQGAYSCFLTGFKHNPTFYMRIIPNIISNLKRLDEVITIKLITAITSGVNFSDMERKLMSLPPKQSGTGILIFCDIADRKYEFSQMLSTNLTSKIVS